ncbi:MAG: hypothetical protein KKB51_16840 [Candidatus Riflebacteria bacterium]|nr:hypothetical protein [Candidatus Riflebacteria bacterium]
MNLQPMAYKAIALPMSYPEVSISLSNRCRNALANRLGTRADESTDTKVIAIAMPECRMTL